MAIRFTGAKGGGGERRLIISRHERFDDPSKIID
jgi:hypothetical protein